MAQRLIFSQRMGYTPKEKMLQIESIDIQLRNALWTAVYLLWSSPLQNSADSQKIHIILWIHFYKEPYDTMPSIEKLQETIRRKFFDCEWHQVYDFLEFVVNCKYDHVDMTALKDWVNNSLEAEFSGYRFIGNTISPITNQHEISTIEKSIQETQVFSSLHGCNLHLTAALKKLSDREHPDYRNSIKESISAVESIAKVISGKETSSLKPALDKISKPLGLHQALVQGFGSLYGWTSQEGGIRHALIDEPSNCDFDDAKYMLVSCSAFVNYLIAKCSKAGIALS